MSHQLISRSFDLKRLRDEGYEVEVRTNYLLVHSVPYVNQQKQIAYGTLVSELTLGGETTVRPNTHVVLFAGGHPCFKDGVPIAQIAHASARQQLLPDLIVDHSFSNKPAAGYVDYYEKMTRYIDIISSAAKALDAQADARTFKPIACSESDSVFCYIDTASSRAGIAAISERLSMFRIAIVGLGGTGSYVLDLVAKSAVREIHLFDDDLYLQHNAFRSPGATDLKDLERQILKVEYLRETYSRLRSGIVAHATRVTEVNVTELKAFNFVFVCVDKGPARKLILDALCAYGVAFVDVGMGVEVTDDQKLFAVCRTTSATIGRTSHLQSRVPTTDIDAEGAYTQNIQISELNALNAAFAVLKWKKIFGIYEDTEQEHHSTYSTNFHLLTGEETVA
jgi:hypothetical protein